MRLNKFFRKPSNSINKEQQNLCDRQFLNLNKLSYSIVKRVIKAQKLYLSLPLVVSTTYWEKSRKPWISTTKHCPYLRRWGKDLWKPRLSIILVLSTTHWEKSRKPWISTTKHCPYYGRWGIDVWKPRLSIILA